MDVECVVATIARVVDVMVYQSQGVAKIAVAMVYVIVGFVHAMQLGLV